LWFNHDREVMQRMRHVSHWGIRFKVCCLIVMKRVSVEV